MKCHVFTSSVFLISKNECGGRRRTAEMPKMWSKHASSLVFMAHWQRTLAKLSPIGDLAK